MQEKGAILLVTSEFPPLPGGIGNHALNLARELQAAGYVVVVHTESRAEDGTLEKNFDQNSGLRVLRVRRHRFFPVTIWRRLILYKIGIRSLPKKRTTVIASGKFSLWLAGISSLFFIRTYVAVLHGVDVNLRHAWLNRFTYWCLRRFDLLIAVSNFTREVMLSHDSKLRIAVINNGFSPPFDLAGLPSPPPILGNPSLVTVGNVSYRKGQHNVIRALPLLASRFPEIHYHIVGIPTRQAELEKLAEDLDVAGRVTFYGAVSDEELGRILQGSKVFCMLSDRDAQGDFEGFGIAILEANYLGIPAIGAGNSGIADAIKAGLNGQLVDPHDAGSILEGLTNILEDYPSYSRQARQWAEQFRWSEVIRHYLALIK